MSLLAQWWTWANCLISAARLHLVLDAVSCQYLVPWSHAVEEKVKSYSARIFSLCDFSACTVQHQRAAMWAFLGIPVWASTATYGSNVTLGNPWTVIGSAMAAREANKRVKACVELHLYQQYHNFRENCNLTKWQYSKSKLLTQRGVFYMWGSYLCPFPVIRVFTAVNCMD